MKKRLIDANRPAKEIVLVDKEGRCVVLPCKVGDAIFVVEKK